MEQIKLLKGTNRFFISSYGYCFKTSKHSKKEEIIPIKIIKGEPRVRIANQRLRFVYLMIEYFKPQDNDNFRIRYKWQNEKIPLDHIKIIRKNFINKDEELIILYKCDMKAYGANSRISTNDKIDKYDVLNSLKRMDFKCTYCGDRLKTKTYHLDHAYPISKGGKNTYNNITPACKKCNTIKSNMQINEFVIHCKKIIENFKTN